MSFDGTLMQMRRPSGSVYDDFPLGLIVAESYKATPNQRLDRSTSKRNVNGVLQRNVIRHMPFKVEFNLRKMTNAELVQFTSFMRAHYTDELQREFYMRYYNDETDSYDTGRFYMPDVQYQKNYVDLENRVIKYAEARVAFIEY